MKIEYKNKIGVKNEQIQFNNNLIMKDYKDGCKIKVTTYKNSDEISARTKFLKDYDEYIFEDLLGQSLCGQELDGDTLWFNIHISGETVYIVSWEFPKNTSEDLQKELSNIAGTFTLAE